MALAAKVPAAQAVQEPGPDEAPLKVPALQFEHALAPVKAEYVPTGQLTHAAAPLLEKVPTGQTTQSIACFTKPALQTSGEQELWPVAR